MELDGQALTLEQIAAVALGGELVGILPSARPRILASRKVVEDIIARDAVVYGLSNFACSKLLLEFGNRRVCPVVPEKGSVGTSGDLAPLAHLALSLIGEG